MLIQDKIIKSEMSITKRYIDLLLPSLAGNEGGEVDTFTLNGKVAYKFPCPFCQSFYDSKKIRNNQMGEIFEASKMKYSSSSWFFRCKRRGSPECRGGTKSFYNFLAIYYPQLFNEYKREIDSMFKMKESKLKQIT